MPVMETVFQHQGVYIVASTCNAKDYYTTHDGIDAGGLRLADHVEIIAASCPNLRKISLIGHSLGGLYVRYCVGVLYARGFFVKIQPINFIALATPHLGIRRPPSRVGLNSMINAISSKLFDRTGAQFALQDTVSEETLALASIHAVMLDQAPIFPDLSGHLEVQLPSPNEGYSKLYSTLRSREWNIYFSHLDLAHPPLFSFDLTDFEAVLHVPENTQTDEIRTENEDDIRNSYYFGDFEKPKDIVLQLRGKNLGEIVTVDARILSSSDWEFVHAVILRVGNLSCVSFSGDKNSVRQENISPPHNQYLLQCLCQGAFLYGLHSFKRRAVYSNVFFDLQAPYSCSAFRSYNPYRNNVVACTPSTLYPHITLHSFVNSTVVREIHLITLEQEEPKPKNWFHGLADLPASIFPVNKTGTSSSYRISCLNATSMRIDSPLPLQSRLFHVVSRDSEQIIVDNPEDAFSTDSLRDVLRGMLMNMQCLSWERIDVLFESMLAHERIVAKRGNEVPINESGIDVVYHIADTFHVG
ncbi:Aste57867_18096 [Aphanomyces stellatus]|uniref:Aste57867_18096 protein n=1 Tax=Aphanomyces stellatus TaxID=120398 RepID=A0A485L9U5_9STRA|nr:hypothetical protein As57867_018034 [Aphanomyces stellatus]VFT94834.1 Aste57867_18096 [Aphanomyces stellatus]